MTITRKVGLTRSSPPKRKRATKRAYKTPRCVYETPTGRRTCRKPQEHIERCKTHADWYLDGLRGQLVRQEMCEVLHRDERWVSTPFACSGAIQDNHGLERSMRRVRWNLDNAFSGCAAVNMWAHQHKTLWTAYLVRAWGAEKYARIVELSVSGPLPDYALIRDELTARLAASR